MNQDQFEIRELVRKIERVLSYIENDDTTGRKGLFAQVEDNKKAIDEIKKNLLIKKGMGAAFGVAGGAIFFLIKIIFDLLTK